jgi:hypothetical protein
MKYMSVDMHKDDKWVPIDNTLVNMGDGSFMLDLYLFETVVQKSDE